MINLKDDHKNLEQKAYEIIKDEILSGKFKPSIRLKETELAHQLNVSRTVIKWAFIRLKEDYLLEDSPTQGIQVKSPSFEEVREAFEFRETLEGICSRIAARTADQKKIDGFIKKFESFKYLDRVRNPEFTRLNFDMHQMIASCCVNKSIPKLVVSLTMLTRTFTTGKLSEYRSLKDSVNEHLEILQTIKDGHEERAEKMMRRHIRKIREALLRAYQKDPSDFVSL